MGLFKKAFLVAVVGIVAFVVYGCFFKEYQLPELARSGYFGPGKPHADNPSINKFTISVSNETLVDLQERLLNARSFDPLEDANFEYGFNTDYLKVVQKYWINEYSWRKAEAKLNSFDHFKTEIEGLQMHFIHAKPASPKKYKKIVPLLLVHGWPGSVHEFSSMIPMLTDPLSHGGTDDLAFTVVAPSIPGYGWSEASHKKGLAFIEVARQMKTLMLKLGYNEFVLQGGDWGSAIVTSIARFYPQHCTGVHVNVLFQSPGISMIVGLKTMIGALIHPSLVVDASEAWKMYPMGEHFMVMLREMGYMHIQATKPDTVGFAVNDSPLGLAAYILEKFSSWTNMANIAKHDGGLGERFSMDDLLTNVMIYWTTGTAASSMRLYWIFTELCFNA